MTEPVKKKRIRSPQPRRSMLKIRKNNNIEFSMAETEDSPIREMLIHIAADRVIQGHGAETMADTMRRLVVEAYTEVRSRQKRQK